MVPHGIMLIGSLGGSTAYRTIVAVSPSDKNTIYLAVGVGGELGYLMKSTDGGSSWTAMTSPPEQVEATGTHFGRNAQFGIQCISK